MHLFYAPDLSKGIHRLEEDEARHCTRVLRHGVGDIIHITDGKGLMAKSRITKIHKSHAEFEIIESQMSPSPDFEVYLYIAPTKNTERMEWMVEKLCEIGVANITFIACQHSERTKLRLDRMEKKAISALKQSKGSWMTQVNGLINIQKAFEQSASDQKLIAALTEESDHLMSILQERKKTDIFIGPEGDFTSEELSSARDLGFIEVSLGTKVLRTETAGLYACSAVHLINKA